MALLANSHGNIYNGVSQQPPQIRAASQCEEMYNVFPSIEYGLVRRSPLEQADGSNSIVPIMSSASENAYTNMIIDGNSVYQLNINDGVPYVVQLQPFYKMLRPGEGINISSPAAAYLKTKLNGKYSRSQYSTTTIKNTTIIANQGVIPATRRVPTTDSPYGEWAMVWLKVSDAVLGIQYMITINGRTFSTVVSDRGLINKAKAMPTNVTLDVKKLYPVPTEPALFLNKENITIYNNVSTMWEGTPVYLSTAHIFQVQQPDGTWSPSPWIANYGGRGMWLTAQEISSIQSYRASLEARSIAISEYNNSQARRVRLEAKKDELDKWLNVDRKHPTNTTVAVSELSAALRSAGYSVLTNGSLMAIKIGTTASISVSDSFGNSAMDHFHKEIKGTELLPSNVPATWNKYFRFKVKQENASAEAAFWVKWNGKVWEETQEDSTVVVNDNTMPIDMRVQFYESGSISGITIGLRQWDDRLVGDDVTNEGPAFFNTKPIRDMFFYRNRIGFLTDNGVSMTESGGYSNLWRTTAIATLDSDPIDFIVSTTSSTALRYSIMNQDKIFIFADNVQFAMDGGAVLGPNSTKVTEVSHYALNLDVPPIVSNNKIIMIGGSENSTIVYEYVYNESYGIANATALTAHVPGYILNDVVSLAASSEDNMIFVVASDHRERLTPYYGDTFDGSPYADINNRNKTRVDSGAAYPDRKIVYMYKYAESGGQKVQSAWAKWNYRGSVLEVAAARGMLYLDIDHEYGDDQLATVIGTGTWMMTGEWDHQGMNWNMNGDAYLATIQLQRRFARQALRPNFLESTTGDYAVSASILDETVKVRTDYKDFGSYINRAWVDLGEFVFKDRASQNYTSGRTQLKAIHIKSDPGSLHTIVVSDLSRGVSREIFPKNNKRFQGIGLASNYYMQTLGSVNVAGRNTIMTGAIPVSDSIYGEETLPGGSLIGEFDTAQIANIGTIPPAQTNQELPHLYGVDVPVFVGGRSDSTRVIISSYYDLDRDYGFRIHDIVQEANINIRHKLS